MVRRIFEAHGLAEPEPVAHNRILAAARTQLEIRTANRAKPHEELQLALRASRNTQKQPS